MNKLFEKNTLKVYGESLETNGTYVLEDIKGNKIEINVEDLVVFMANRESYIKYVILGESPFDDEN